MASNKRDGKRNHGSDEARTQRPETREVTDERRRGTPGDGHFPVVGLGASAGGLEALEQFFSHTPIDSGVAFVVVTHLHAGHTSLMAELLARKTTMPIVEIAADTPVRADHVYTARPGFNLEITGGVLRAIAVDEAARRRMPIDSFFRSLAKDQKERAIGIVLSGNGTDGSLGIQEVKAELGMVMVQEEQSAAYAGMPHSAIATKLVDYVLPAHSMPARLLAYVRGLDPDGRRAEVVPEAPPDALQQIFTLVCDGTGHDFSLYKSSTVNRRIARRMNVHHLGTIADYVDYLRANPGEVDLLFKELLIGVTSFFRDPEAWAIMPPLFSDLLRQKADNYVVRAWVPGCSTGEEAYSLAIMLRETMDTLGRTLSVQIFATDLDPASIDVARLGVYPSGIANDVSPQRLARFFSQEDGIYRVKKEIREMIVFATQNLIADPPFTKLDILSCRNVLIYLGSELQKRLLPIFCYSLKPGGLLMVGSAESTGAASDLFETVDKKWKIFRRRQAPVGGVLTELPTMHRVPASNTGATPGVQGRAVTLEHVAEKSLLRDMVPPTVLVRERGDIMYVHGRTGLFLEPQQGSQIAANIFNMAREGLQVPLAAALRHAAETGVEAVRRGIRVKTNGDYTTIDLRVVRVQEPEILRGLLRVAFEPVPSVGNDGNAAAGGTDAPPDRVGELEKELAHRKESHEGTIAELETANEELKSINEELQSTNEELETSKEEMHSLNEELQTVNSELQSKVEELSRANNDMKNLLNATSIATVFLDEDLRIKRYTEPAKKVVPLIPTDVGRPIADLASTLHYDRLVEDAHEVLHTLVFKETEVTAGTDSTYLMRILPYRTTENVIEGLVLTFVDITRLKVLQHEQHRLLQALANSQASVFGQDREIRYIWASNHVFGRPPGELIGKNDAAVLRTADAELVTAMKRRVLASGVAERRQLQLEIDGVRRSFDLYVEPKRDAGGAIDGLSGVAVDITPPA
ncbi:MAG TPA: chemotaxis protein CheB [Planctomycetota bacterium]